MPYLTAAAARTRLTNLGKYPDLSEAALVDLLPALEDVVDAWLGWRAALTIYRETTKSDRLGHINLTNSPLQRIDLVASALPSGQIASQVLTQPWQPINYLWIPQDNRLKVFQSHMPVQVTYVAGYNPLPRVFMNTVFQLLNAALEKSGVSGDLTFLNEPVKDVASVSLPGGLNKSFFKAGQASTSLSNKNGSGETQIDRLLSPLKQYRRHYVLTTGSCIRIGSGDTSDIEFSEVDGGLY